MQRWLARELLFKRRDVEVFDGDNHVFDVGVTKESVHQYNTLCPFELDPKTIFFLNYIYNYVLT